MCLILIRIVVVIVISILASLFLEHGVFRSLLSQIKQNTMKMTMNQLMVWPYWLRHTVQA